jgi:predicted nucleic acid-binding protein
MPFLLDTSVLIGAEDGPEDEVAISVVSLTELHFGVLVAPNEEARADRVKRLGIVESNFDALPFDAAAARECGRLHAAVARRGGQPRRRAFDLAIAATANVHGVPLLSHDVKDFQIIEDLVEVRALGS